MAFIGDITKETFRRIRELARTKLQITDEQELGEREDAAQAYAGETPKHFVDYKTDCKNQSVKASVNIRQIQKECWSVYNEEKPPNYAKKENWQSKVVIPKPFAAVQFAMAIVRKAFSTEFLSVENEINQDSADFYERLMKHQLNRRHANFPIRFTDATGLAFAVGQSLEVIPCWVPGTDARAGRLRLILVEPWKIHRDPDARSRQPQDGMYWIHEEYVDFHALKRIEKTGRYQDVDRVKGYIDAKSDDLTPEEIAARKNQIWQRSEFRTSVLVSEFWGEVLDSKGDLLLERATYTTAGRDVIGLPKIPAYRSLRWPGISFSPLPHFLRYEGRGLLEGVRSLWYWMCSLLALHSDALNWIVNPPTEINIHGLVDQNDIDNYPGKQFLTKDTISGQQVVREVQRKNITNEILANLQYGDQNFQRGSFVADIVGGLPGWRQEVTAREQAQNLEQALNPFTLMGLNLEDGAIQIMDAVAEVIEANIGVDELSEVFKEEEISGLIDRDPDSRTGIRLPEFTGSYHVSGISAILKDTEIINSIRDMILPLFGEDSVFEPYLRPYQTLKSIERRLNLKDEGLVVNDDEAKAIKEAQDRAAEADSKVLDEED